ncbi:MAG: hypothetical protein AB2A00_17005 [Myxococcota bacterium]
MPCRRWCVVALCAGLMACEDLIPKELQPGQARMPGAQLVAAVGDRCDVTSVQYEVISMTCAAGSVGDDSLQTGSRGVIELRDDETVSQFLPLPQGCYRVRMQPLNRDGVASDDCAPTSKRVTIGWRPATVGLACPCSVGRGETLTQRHPTVPGPSGVALAP